MSTEDLSLSLGSLAILAGPFGGSLTLGWEYGARFTVERWTLRDGRALVLTHIGGYVSF